MSGYNTNVAVKPARTKQTYRFGITYQDGGYSVRHAENWDHAKKLGEERYPGRAIEKIEMKDGY